MSKKVLLYSGGTDSWLIEKLWKPDVLLYVNMDTKYSDEEIRKLTKLGVTKDGRFQMAYFPLGDYEDKETAFIPARNLYLLLLACNYGDEICLGAVKEDAGGTSDNDIDFLKETQKIINRLWGKQSGFEGKKIRVNKKFIKYTKEELLQQYLKKGGDINVFKNETFSCYSPVEKKECLGCRACFRKFIPSYQYGAKYTKEELEKMYNYIENNIVHRSHHFGGRYFLDKPDGKEVLQVIEKLYKELGKELDLE